MRKMNITSVAPKKCTMHNFITCIYRDQKGFNVVSFLFYLAIVVLLALLFIPNINLFLGIEKKINAANLEANNLRAAAISYEIDHQGKYPVDSNALLQAGNYIIEPRAYYTFDSGTGRITSATTDTAENTPANPWVGIRWDSATDNWVKQ